MKLSKYYCLYEHVIHTMSDTIQIQLQCSMHTVKPPLSGQGGTQGGVRKTEYP